MTNSAQWGRVGEKKIFQLVDSVLARGWPEWKLTKRGLVIDILRSRVEEVGLEVFVTLRYTDGKTDI